LRFRAIIRCADGSTEEIPLHPRNWLLIALMCLSSATVRAEDAIATPHVKKSQAALLTETLSILNLSSPVADLKKSLERNDLRFVGINRYTCMAPGIGGTDTELPQQYGLRCLFGTSDFIESREHAVLINAARRYAERYNAELARVIHRGSAF